MRVYFGTYTGDRDEGVYYGELDMQTGRLTVLGGVGGVTNPSFVTPSRDGRFLYNVAEGAQADSGAAAFAIDPDTGALTLLNKQLSGGAGACHVGLDPAGTTAIVSNYTGGSVATFPIQEDGSLGPRASFIQHADTSGGPEPKRPHAHCAKVDARGRFVLNTDLGLDQVFIYTLDPATSRLTPHDQPGLTLQEGAGPRHLAFHPDAPYVYLINELDSTMSVMRWDASAGSLSLLQTLSTLPVGYDGKNSTAEVVVHPNGRFLYGSNRGHDSLVIYAIDPDTGLLTLVGFEPTTGKEPRNFNIDPTGRFLIVCHHRSDTVQVFRIDPDRGTLTAMGEPVAVPMPVCVAFVQPD